jgi:methylmalonyl-CoA decarboxylase
MAENPAQPVVTTQTANDIGIATISKPPVNPLSGDVCDQLLKSFDEFERAHVRAVIIRANPNTKIWSAGHDIREIPLDGHDAVTWTTGFERVLHRVRSCTVQVIAMLHSSVWGAACDLAVTCDLAIGTPKTTFAITPVKIGISYNTAGMSHFLGVLPLHIIKEMVVTGNPLSAEDAYRFGLLNRQPRASGGFGGQDRAEQLEQGNPHERRRVRVHSSRAASRLSERRPQRGRQGVL